jgi:hypothetical protein
MFAIPMPNSFKVGDTIDGKVNGEPRRITWRDSNTLVIEPADCRTIIRREPWDANSTVFVCESARKDAA